MNDLVRVPNQRISYMKKLNFVALVFAAAAAPAMANHIPVPSFNDTPEHYTHPTPGKAQPMVDVRKDAAARSASQGASTPRADKRNDAVAPDGGSPRAGSGA